VIGEYAGWSRPLTLGILWLEVARCAMATDDPVEVFAASDATEAQFVRGLLAEDAIEATIVGEPLRGILGDVPFFMAGPRLWVRPADAERARAVVAEYETRVRERVRNEAVPAGTADQSGRPEILFCYHCGEPVESGRQTCAACGQELDWNGSETKPA
jgi:hypothetical protein